MEGRLYCPSDGLKEDIPIKIKSISNPNPLVANTTKNLPKNYFPPLATQLHSTERILWKHIKTKGFWHKRIVEAMEITHEAVIFNDVRIPWNSITDVLVMNSNNIGVGIVLHVSFVCPALGTILCCCSSAIIIAIIY